MECVSGPGMVWNIADAKPGRQGSVCVCVCACWAGSLLMVTAWVQFLEKETWPTVSVHGPGLLAPFPRSVCVCVCAY